MSTGGGALARIFGKRARTLKLLALASVSVLAAGFSAHAQTVPTSTASRLRPYYGNLRPFYGDLTPYYGNLRPFYGNLRPFYGNLRPFWGDTAAFWGTAQPFGVSKDTTFWGSLPGYVDAKGHYDGQQVGGFWTKSGQSWDQINAAWLALTPSSPATSFQNIDKQLQAMVNSASSFWGPQVQARTGKSFQDGFVTPLMTKYGIDLNKPPSLLSLDQTDRAMFFLDWYDGLMNYSGADHVDWWMGAVNWNPALTQTQGSGARTTIGLLDFTVAGDVTIQKSIIKYDGISNFSNGHGAAVASLMVGAHDGQGVMGIAPKASVVAYNPFDSTGTAGWGDISNGIQMLARNNASVINMSLGVPGETLDQGWNDVFSNAAVAQVTKHAVFVIAAGNDGVSQTQNLNWNFATNPNIIVVGSVGADGTISNFSNRPGTACLLNAGSCTVGNRLMDHFIVAPGELIMVSDDKGGTVRESGTSFAAPLVSGAIALLQDRWPWLANYPTETADIILKSAKDLGAPGPDPVYGMGELDVTAAQAPLNFNNLVWYYKNDKTGALQPESVANVLTNATAAGHGLVTAHGAYYYAFEPIGATQRDFAIPLSSKLVGQYVTTSTGVQEMFQTYILARLNSWTAGQTATAGKKARFDLTSTTPMANPWGMDMTLTIAPAHKAAGFMQSGPAYQSRMHVNGEHSSMDFGYGDGAVALTAVKGFSAADHDSDFGGDNPILGLASGGAFANWSYDLDPHLQVSAGLTQRYVHRDPAVLFQARNRDGGASAYQAEAEHVGLAWRFNDRLTVAGAYTRLYEPDALLGTQSLDPRDFGNGSSTDGLTMSMGLQLGRNTGLSASGTFSRTNQSGADQALQVTAGGLRSSAFEVALSRKNLFTGGDVARLSLLQPMYVNSGQLKITGVQVVDRATGALGVASQTVDIAQQRPYAAEFLYGRPLFNGAADVSLFGRLDLSPGSDTPALRHAVMAGAMFRVGL